LGSEEVFNQFNRLEEKIETLINKCVALDRENSDLKAKISEIEEKVKLKEDAEIDNLKVNEELKQKIDNIIEKISEYGAETI